METGQAKLIALVGRSAADVRDVMIEGESGLLRVCPPWFRPKYEPSKRKLTWPNGAEAHAYSGDEPNQLRGPQHDAAWCDELAAWRYPDAWDQLQFGLRLGAHPRVVVTTTPRPLPHVKELLADPKTHITRGSTFDNAGNLAKSFLRRIRKKYEGTRLGRQELNAEILDDNPHALWQRPLIEKYRVTQVPDLVRIAVAVDPPAGSGQGAEGGDAENDGAAECGIVVAGVDARGHAYVLEDCSRRDTPAGWGKQSVSAYHRNRADRVVAEVNQGGDMVEHVLRTVDPQVSYTGVRASRGKYTRAEPIAALYEQGMVHHVGIFGELEDQMCEWMPGLPSPDRMDALVWALTYLMLDAQFGVSSMPNVWD